MHLLHGSIGRGTAENSMCHTELDCWGQVGYHGQPNEEAV